VAESLKHGYKDQNIDEECLMRISNKRKGSCDNGGKPLNIRNDKTQRYKF